VNRGLGKAFDIFRGMNVDKGTPAGSSSSGTAVPDLPNSGSDHERAPIDETFISATAGGSGWPEPVPVPERRPDGPSESKLLTLYAKRPPRISYCASGTAFSCQRA
jgi:hypothetical protein